MSASEETAAGPSEREPDYRFTLANERTFLAYLRTALALDAGGLAVVQFLTAVDVEELRKALGLILIALGMVLSVAAYARWRRNMEAMRRDVPLPSTRVPLFLTLTLVAVSAVAVVLVVFG